MRPIPHRCYSAFGDKPPRPFRPTASVGSDFTRGCRGGNLSVRDRCGRSWRARTRIERVTLAPIGWSAMGDRPTSSVRPGRLRGVLAPTAMTLQHDRRNELGIPPRCSRASCTATPAPSGNASLPVSAGSRWATAETTPAAITPSRAFRPTRSEYAGTMPTRRHTRARWRRPVHTSRSWEERTISPPSPSLPIGTALTSSEGYTTTSTAAPPVRERTRESFGAPGPRVLSNF